MTMSDKCATHILNRGKCESLLVKAPAQHAGESVRVVSELYCTRLQGNTKEHNQGMRPKCAHVGKRSISFTCRATQGIIARDEIEISLDMEALIGKARPSGSLFFELCIPLCVNVSLRRGS